MYIDMQYLGHDSGAMIISRLPACLQYVSLFVALVTYRGLRTSIGVIVLLKDVKCSRVQQA